MFRVGLCEDYPEESRSMAAAMRDLELAQSTGAKVLRIAFGWDAIEPEQGTYDWSFWDEFVRLATEKYGITLVPYICYTPRWAAEDKGENFWRSPPGNPEDFARFVEVIVARYSHWIQTWELWNEPDNKAYWLGSVEEFAELTRAGSRAVRRTDAKARVVLGGLAGELDFLEQLFREQQIAPFVDVVNFHSYLETWHPDPIERLGEEVERAADIVDSFGEEEPLWLAEVGYSSVGSRAKTSESYQPRFDFEHSPDAQAHALLRFVVVAAASRRIDTFAWYRINDLPAHEDVIGDDNNRHLGLLSLDGQTKPAAAAFRFVARLFDQRYRTLQLQRLHPTAHPAECYGFEFEDGRTFIFAWHRSPGSRPASSFVTSDQRSSALRIRVPVKATASLVNLWPQQGRINSNSPAKPDLHDGQLTVPVQRGAVTVVELRTTPSLVLRGDPLRANVVDFATVAETR